MPAEPAGSHTATATILFTDLVDSTAQRTRLGEERAETLRRTHDRLLADAIAAHRGTVAKHVGDGMMATFPGAADAVAAAVAIQQAIEGHNRRATPEPLAVRVGISLGDITWENGDCFGTPVIEAARLCAVAEGGQILAADLVRLTARGRGGHTFTPIGPVALKGLSEPVVACAVAWEPLVHVGLPIPPRLGTRSPFAMFGRGVEEEALALAWAKARDGQRQVVLLAGEPGIGKTRLATETARAAHAEGGTVLFGACDEDVGLPYRPFVEALRHYVTHAPEAVLAAHVASHHGELARLVPELAQRVPDPPAPQVAEAETERFLLFEAVTGLLAAASQESPIVLVLDDLHWAGAPELLLLKHLIRSAEPMRLLVVATYRDTDLSRTHPLTAVLADLRRESGVERVSLHGLDDAAVEVLVAAVARHELDDALVALAHTVRRETEGNPFFIGEVIRHLSESGVLFQAGGRWTYRGAARDLGIPEGVREVIGRRLGRLSEATSRILGFAAVIGRQFDVTLLAKVAETSEDAVLDALDEATAAALVGEVRGSRDEFIFRHALIRTTLYEELSAPRRARLHRRVGEALEELTRSSPGTRIAELAHHWLSATQVTDGGKAIAYARQAGDQALINLAFEEAATQYEHALSVLEPRDRNEKPLRCDLLTALGDAQRRGGNAAYRATVALAVESARTLGDGERLARAALGNALPGGVYVASAAIVDHGLTAVYEEAISGLEARDGVLKMQLLAQLATQHIFTGERARRHQLSHEALAMARRLGDDTALAVALNARAYAISDPSTLAERRQTAAELDRVAVRLGSLEMQYAAAQHAAGVALETGDVERTQQCIDSNAALAARLRQPYYSWLASYSQAMLAVMRGDPNAEQEVLAAFQVGTGAGVLDAATVMGAQLSLVRRDQGRIGEVVPALQRYVEEQPHVEAWRQALAEAYSETDRLSEAREQVTVLAARSFDITLNWTWPSSMSLLADVCDALRDRSAAALLYPKITPFAAQVAVGVVSALCYGSYAYSCGLLATVLERWEEAERHFEAALAMNQRIGACPYVVRTRRGWATMLLDRNAPGDAARARDLIAAGRAEAETLGMARELVRFERLTERLPA